MKLPDDIELTTQSLAGDWEFDLDATLRATAGAGMAGMAAAAAAFIGAVPMTETERYGVWQCAAAVAIDYWLTTPGHIGDIAPAAPFIMAAASSADEPAAARNATLAVLTAFALAAAECLVDRTEVSDLADADGASEFRLDEAKLSVVIAAAADGVADDLREQLRAATIVAWTAARTDQSPDPIVSLWKNLRRREQGTVSLHLQRAFCRRFGLPEPDTSLAHYRLKAIVAIGGTAAVYWATDTHGDGESRDAIKVLRPDRLEHSERFKNECWTNAKLDHPS